MTPKDVGASATTAPQTRPAPHVDAALYASMYQSSIANPEGFWSEEGKRIEWMKPFTKVKNMSLSLAISIFGGSRTAH